ncbi:TetR/AcrR family transcriptional regulator [Halorubrum laminariae]|uniref:TetR/AcrR family transcriptional regulator n=1 Tax=Halorubrum laminariae TaxID=1433523 RepID=A0ABD6C3G6_9EURY|nr:TetR/AcrR family transcriptional regulator [Halorubrum laminariae]
MSELPDGTAADGNSDIMQATYRALRDHGYADLTVQRIADEYGKSTAAIHYHYDTKEDLLAAFLDYLLARFVDAIRDIETTDPDARLSLLLDELLAKPAETQGLSVALLEMRSQAPYNDAFRERFAQNDEYVRYALKAVINHGIDEGAFADVDAERAAHALLSIADGGRTRAVVFDDMSELELARQTASEYVDATLR